ncbi:hypothetical protein BDV41DRAFT_534763 [Aspergillus transmontanensis]|uniref:Rhamnogalacturonan lyase domain-containing protein n=1 Tax=Aspergillus transmontanensis TaxID=1034304 RepID=A0A5N6VZN4_9EURO|nr:hypothetical protein BDV41DRAFT_534763 [Aspergillus transmontanensis]
MHPSDNHMSDWNPGTFVVGENNVGDFPMCLWQGINSPTTIQFSMNGNLSTNVKIRVATTI